MKIKNFPKKKYSIILADPPWSYNDKNCRGNCDQYYQTIKIKELCKLPVNKIINKDCVLFLWATYPMLKEALILIDAWGFKYKTIAFQWIKKNKKNGKYFFGLGRWTRGNTEPCLLATKGKPKRKSNMISQIIVSPIRKHSQKPDVQYKLIEELIGKLPRIELFARNKFDGWDVWGNEIQEFTQKRL